MKLSVHLVAWSGSKYIPYLFESLRKQTFENWELLVIDNHSTDNTSLIIQKELTNFPVPFRVIANTDNRGFAGGHNQAFRETSGEYVLLLNQDTYLTSDCFAKMVNFIETHPEVGAVAPRLMRWDFDKIVRGSKLPETLSDYVDALGIRVFRNRRAVERYTQEYWPALKPRFKNNSMLEVFGVSGALPLYRRSSLSAVAFADGNFLDPWYFSYKEDLDLAHRLQSAGFKSYVLLDAVAYHDRTGAGPRELNDLTAARNKQSHNHLVKYYSYRNHLATLYKNECWQNFLLDFPWILWYEFKKFVYFLLFDWSVLNGLGELWQARKNLKTKKLKIKSLRKANWIEIRKWWK